MIVRRGKYKAELHIEYDANHLRRGISIVVTLEGRDAPVYKDFLRDPNDASHALQVAETIVDKLYTGKLLGRAASAAPAEPGA